MLIKPKKIQPGDTIGIISPAGAVKDDSKWRIAVNFLESLGYKVKISTNAKNKKAYLAGNDEDRLFDLMSFFEDAEIKAIFCSRGGYGTYRLLSKINYEKIKNNPKIFVGYSDITALLLNFMEKSGIITFHGPLAISDFGTLNINNYTANQFFNILENNIKIPYSFSNLVDYECIIPGKTEGKLIAGNLTVLLGLLGTPYFPDLKNKILLLEDVGEPLYKIDRMLMQLKLAGIFEQISGLLFGEFTSITPSENPEVDKISPKDIIKEIIKDINIPVGYGFSASHADLKSTLPLGVKYHFNSEDFQLVLLEEYFI